MTDTNINLTDYKTILSYKGKIGGDINSCKIDEFSNCLESLKDDILKAKAIIINFQIHKEQEFLIINDFMAKIHTLSNDDAEIIFDTGQTNNIDIDSICYQIILTGL